MPRLERWRHSRRRSDAPECILRPGQGRHRSELRTAHYQHPNLAFRRDRRPSWTSLCHSHDVERCSRAVLDVRLSGSLDTDCSLEQHVESVWPPTLDGQHFAGRRLDCVSLGRQEQEFALAALGEEMDTSETFTRAARRPSPAPARR